LASDPRTEVATYTIAFDGGSLGNPGKGYGSYAIAGPRRYEARAKLRFDHLGDRITSNEAEYLTLIAALERLADDLGERAARSRVSVRGDSQLVVNQLLGAWKVRKNELKPLHYRASELLNRFGGFDLAWHPRRHSVRLFGH
jgi:ribonuclease HI